MLLKESYRQYFAEFIGTFILVFCGTGAIVISQTTGSPDHGGIAITFGLVVMSVIYAFGDISGAHLNPAVSIGFWLAKQFPLKKLLPYCVFQVGGALFASYTLKVMFPENKLLGATLPFGSWEQTFVLELILTFILMLVILLVATGSKEKGIMAGIAIGSVVGLEAMFAGPISGASMNPARSISPAVASGHLEHLWVYIVSTILGAIIAAIVYKTLFNHEEESAGTLHRK